MRDAHIWIVAIRKSRPLRWIGGGWFKETTTLKIGPNCYVAAFYSRADARRAIRLAKESPYFKFDVEPIRVTVRLVRA